MKHLKEMLVNLIFNLFLEFLWFAEHNATVYQTTFLIFHKIFKNNEFCEYFSLLPKNKHYTMFLMH